MHNFPSQLSYVLTLHENILKQNMHAFFLLGRLSVVLLPSTLAAFTDFACSNISLEILPATVMQYILSTDTFITTV